MTAEKEILAKPVILRGSMKRPCEACGAVPTLEVIAATGLLRLCLAHISATAAGRHLRGTKVTLEVEVP